MATISRGKTDGTLKALKTALEAYEKAFPDAKADLYRLNPGAVRVRIVDSRFERMSKATRHDKVWDFLQERVGPEVMEEVYTLTLLPPKDLQASFANYEFEHPVK